jgi:uncharacterized iron-regulated protein
MEMTFKLHIPDDDFQSFVSEVIENYHDYSLSDLGLTPKDKDSLMKEAKSRFQEAIQAKVDDWYDEVDHERFAYSLTNHAALDKAIEALRQKEETEEQKRDLEERIASAAKFLQKHGHTVKRKG